MIILEKHSVLLVILSFLVICKSQGNFHYYDFVLKEKNFTKLCSTKSILTVNDSFPGPTIRVQKGDTAFVTVHNQGRYGVTIHWHGVREPRDPWSDGPENITQCPIPPGTSFTQKVAFTLEEGTLWWHAHSSWTRATVHGAIVILPANGTSYPFRKPCGQKILIIGEWHKGDVMQIINAARATGGEPNASDAYTINGQPGDFYNCSKETTRRFLVDYGKTYLFRIINAAMNEEHFFGVANHNLIVVGVDGSYTKPLNTNFIMITPGQTMDVLVSANQPKGLYYIAASPFYDGINMNISGVFSEDFPDQPPFLYNFTGDTGSTTLIPSTGTRVLMFDYNEVVELVWQGTSVLTAENHAMHLHGFSFFVVGVGTGNFNNVTDPKSYNLIDPPEVNTIGLPKNGWLAMRFVADNPGVWYMHCHLERHTSWGMDTVLIVRDGVTMQTSMIPPPKYMPPCS